uniref:Gag-pol polyprotein n=1 Tax=Solanum tuberosum TaxID=4113 RepID=M1DWR4_SOLTU
MRAKTPGDEFGQQKSNVNRSSFQQKQKGPTPSSASAPAPRNQGLNTLEQKVISRPIGDSPTGLSDLQAFISSFFSSALFLLAK